MAFKNISLSLEAYDTLKKLKHKDESFSEEVMRLTKKSEAKISDVIGIFTDVEAEQLRKGVEEVRKSFKVRTWR